MSIESIVASATSASSAAGTADRELIADNLDTFLQLLTTQLQNQNPLDPLDTNQFTEQLVQFSAVEQAVKSNDLLTSLVAANTATTTSTAIGYIGKSVLASGATTSLKSGSAEWTYKVDEDAPNASITVRNTSGEIVHSELTTFDAGTNTFTWDGTTSTGGTAPEGLYTVTMTAANADGNNLKVSTSVEGEVTGVEFEGSEPVLIVGTSRVNLSSVQTVSAI